MVWTARVPAVACLLVLGGSILDFFYRGPIAPWLAAVVGVVAAAGTVAFVYYGALLETEFNTPRALREMPRVFLQDVLLFGIVAVVSLLAPGGRDFGGGGDGGGRTGGARPLGSPRRSNFASGLVDPVEVAGILGTQHVEVRADGLEGPTGSLASIVGTDARGKIRARVWLHVYQQRAAEYHWARASASAQPVQGPGDAALSSADRFTFKRGDTVVELHMTKKPDAGAAPNLAGLASAVDRRLQQ